MSTLPANVDTPMQLEGSVPGSPVSIGTSQSQSPAIIATQLPVDPLSFVRLESRHDGDGEYLLRVTQNESALQRGCEYVEYSFLVIAKYHRRYSGGKDFTIRIQNEALKQAVKNAIGEVHGISWKLSPLEIPTTPILCSFYPELCAHLSTLDDESEQGKHLQLLIRYLETDHVSTLEAIKELTTHGLINYDTLPFVYIPRSLLFFQCHLSSLPRAARLLAIHEVYSAAGAAMWELECEYTELSHNKNGHEPGKPGPAELKAHIAMFEGSVDITSLMIYPLKFHQNAETVARDLEERGRRWARYTGTHHLHCDGIGYELGADPMTKQVNIGAIKILGDIMVDKNSYAGMSRASLVPNVKNSLADQAGLSVDSVFALKFVEAETKEELNSDHFIISTPLCYGYSFHDHSWVAVPIDALSEIQWQNEAFTRLELPSRQKELLRTVVAAHVEPMGRPSLDDFIQRKGKGLVISLHGTSGVGKTLTAECLSQLFHKPIYVVQREIKYWSGATMESVLKEVFSLATLWDAMVLFDEADSYLQQREPDAYQTSGSLLQQLEYFSGIVFFTTNHVRVIDKAFKSRIHLSLHYPDLSPPVRQRIWTTFLERAGTNTKAITQPQWRYLASLELNGREIKNVIRTSQDYIMDKKREVAFADLLYVMSTIQTPAKQKLALWWNGQVAFWSSNTSQALPVCILLLSAHLALLTILVGLGFLA